MITRATNGYLRQKSLQTILDRNEALSIPFTVLLLGEYVIEIHKDILAAHSGFDLERYKEFVRQNRPLMRRTRARANSYWNAYYRRDYPDRRNYPAIVMLNQLDEWAS